MVKHFLFHFHNFGEKKETLPLLFFLCKNMKKNFSLIFCKYFFLGLAFNLSLLLIKLQKNLFQVFESPHLKINFGVVTAAAAASDGNERMRGRERGRQRERE